MNNLFKKGISLKEFERLRQLGEDAPESEQTKRLLLKKSNKVFKTQTLNEMTFSDFIDCETFIKESNFLDFCRIFVKRKFYQTIYVHNLETILADYAKQKKEIFEQHNWIFDPPSYGEPTKETIGSELRKDFVKEFGPYVVLMDLICKGRMSDYKQVEQWTVGEFLFWADYLSGQKIIETVK